MGILSWEFNQRNPTCALCVALPLRQSLARFWRDVEETQFKGTWVHTAAASHDDIFGIFGKWLYFTCITDRTFWAEVQLFETLFYSLHKGLEAEIDSTQESFHEDRLRKYLKLVSIEAVLHIQLEIVPENRHRLKNDFCFRECSEGNTICHVHIHLWSRKPFLKKRFVIKIKWTEICLDKCVLFTRMISFRHWFIVLFIGMLVLFI